MFTNITKYDAISFINNSAKLSGNSIYFSFHKYCDVIRNHTRNDSAAFIPYKFNYTQSHIITGSPIATTPYEMNLCSSPKCELVTGTNSSKCIIHSNIMLGQPLYFNTTVCDYFYVVAEASYFQVNCINCGTKYRLFDDKILVQSGLKSNISFLSVNSDRDLQNDTNITLTLLSYSPNIYKQLTATLSLKLSSCYNGFTFNKKSQKCECYNKYGFIRCEGDAVSIKLGYWFGDFSGQHTISLCGSNYCNFFSTRRKETSNGFYNLPEKINDQCNPHRTGVACGECSEGYTLAYNSPDCISEDKCSPGMMVLVLVLTILYWIAILVFLFGVAYYLKMQAKMSIGYLHGIIYFYSTVDILLCNNLYVTDQVFYTVTSLSSFAKLNPGRLCFITDLEAVDQQFIHYFHVVLIAMILVGIVIVAKISKNMAFYIDHCIVQVVCLFLLLSYSSLTSISFLLLRSLKLSNIDGLHTYLSPHLKYFTNHHAVYGSVAIFCVLLVILCFLIFLLTQPCLWLCMTNKVTPKYKKCKRFKRWIRRYWFRIRWHIRSFLAKRIDFIKINQIIYLFQDCYKDHCRWFASYYLICRLVIMLITYFANNDYNNMIYYLQTACVVIVLIHILVQPYKSDTLNLIDTSDTFIEHAINC